ncbi:TPA: GspE/PulE family protein, partial [Salmonella enterica]
IGMISQRLVPTLCPHCRIPWSEKVASLSPEQTAFLTRYGNREGICSTENMYFRNHEGCPACNRDVVINGRKRATVSRGVTGRTVIAEVVETDARLFRLLRT